MQGLCALVVVLAVTGSAWARAQVDLPYSQAEIFSTALRFIRIERGCKIVDKDPDAAFITFACVEGDKTKRGSLEIFASSDADHRPTLRVQVTLGDDPHYVENRFLELFGRKLRDEHGTPPPLAAAPKNPDAGT